MLKRVFDFIASGVGLLLASPVMFPVMALVWAQDYHSPFYIADRMGKGDKPFRMVKLRSMVKNADKSGVDSTSSNDPRITGVGRFIRRYKLDELSQLWNVFIGDMSLVGPRPNVQRETDLYTDLEKGLLTVRPGITDFASIVFADENDILADSEDPDLDYNQLIRPWKSRLGLLYIEHRTLFMDARLIFLTLMNSVSRSSALASVESILTAIGADADVLAVARRDQPLVPSVPPGASSIVTRR